MTIPRTVLAKILFLASFTWTLLLAYLASDGSFYPLGAGMFLAGLYLMLVGLIFFFRGIPQLRRRLLEAAIVVLLFVSFYLFPPLSLAAIPTLFFILLMPLYLGLRHGVFFDILHVALWLVLSAGLGAVLYWPMPKVFWAQVLSAGVSSLTAHYILLKIYPRLRKRQNL